MRRRLATSRSRCRLSIRAPRSGVGTRSLVRAAATRRAPPTRALRSRPRPSARLMAIMALLTGVHHLSRRRAVELLSDIVGVRSAR
jgi:hypothetical protein